MASWKILSFLLFYFTTFYFLKEKIRMSSWLSWRSHIQTKSVFRTTVSLTRFTSVHAILLLFLSFDRSTSACDVVWFIFGWTSPASLNTAHVYTRTSATQPSSVLYSTSYSACLAGAQLKRLHRLSNDLTSLTFPLLPLIYLDFVMILH